MHVASEKGEDGSPSHLFSKPTFFLKFAHTNGIKMELVPTFFPEKVTNGSEIRKSTVKLTPEECYARLHAP